jgi:xylulokinase
MDRALVEGVTFALKQTLELIQQMNTDIRSLRITGGGAKSKVWAQMIADVMNVEVSTIEIEEGPSLGAAILAMVGAQVYPSVEDACQAIIKEKDVFKPISSNVLYYEKKYQVFKTLYPSMKALFPRLDVIE